MALYRLQHDHDGNSINPAVWRSIPKGAGSYTIGQCLTGEGAGAAGGSNSIEATPVSQKNLYGPPHPEEEGTPEALDPLWRCHIWGSVPWRGWGGDRNGSHNRGQAEE